MHNAINTVTLHFNSAQGKCFGQIFTLFSSYAMVVHLESGGL